MHQRIPAGADGGAARQRGLDEALRIVRQSGAELRIVLGSDAESVVRTSPVPVLLVRAPT